MFENIDAVSFISTICFALGGYFILSSAVGLLRMPDFFTRLHPAGMSDSMGLPLILIGAILEFDFGLVTAKILIIIALSMITSSTSCHALAKAAIHSGLKPWTKPKQGKKS